MAVPVVFPEQNFIWKAPPDTDCSDLPTYIDGDNSVSISCWQVTPEEIAEIVQTGKVWLYVWGVHPPVR